jgi:hypothetical protein
MPHCSEVLRSGSAVRASLDQKGLMATIRCLPRWPNTGRRCRPRGRANVTLIHGTNIEGIAVWAYAKAAHAKQEPICNPLAERIHPTIFSLSDDIRSQCQFSLMPVLVSQKWHASLTVSTLLYTTVLHRSQSDARHSYRRTH